MKPSKSVKIMQDPALSSEARFGAQPEHPQSESHASFSEVQSYQAWQKADAWPASPENSISSMPSMPSRPSRFNQEDEMVNGYRPHRMEEVINWQSPERNGRNGRAFESTNESREWERQPAPAIFHEPEPEAVHEIPTEDPWLQEENFSKRQDWNSHDPIEPQRQPGKFLEQLPDPAEPERRMPTLPRKTTDYEQDWMLFCRIAMYSLSFPSILLCHTATVVYHVRHCKLWHQQQKLHPAWRRVKIKLPQTKDGILMDS